MNIQAINTINTNFAAREVKAYREDGNRVLTITSAHVNAVSGLNAHLIDHLAALGFINMPMLKAARMVAAQEQKENSAANVQTIIDILQNPDYKIEKRDNGYFYMQENRFNSSKKETSYAKGNTEFYTPVLKRQHEFEAALRNLAQKSTLNDALKLLDFIFESIRKGDMIERTHQKAISKAAKNKTLSLCVYPKKEAYGLVEEFNLDDFLLDNLYIPINKAVDSARRRG